MSENYNIYSFFKKDSSIAFVAGGIAGAVSRTVVSPFERVKILLQVQNSVSIPSSQITYNNGVLNAIKQVYKEENIKGLFRGNGINCIRIFPYSAIQFVVFEYCKKNLYHIDNSKQLTNGQRLVCGSLGGLASLVMTHPLDLVRTRLSIQTASINNLTKSKAKDIQKPPGFKDLIVKIYKNEGKIIGLYRGIIPTSLQMIPCVALNFAVYEQLKEFTPSKEDTNYWKDNLYILFFGAASGAVSQTITYPFDLLRKRFQILTMGNNELGFHYTGIWDALKTIGRTEGILGYYKGLTANLFKVIPSTAVSWLVYEGICDVMRTL